MDGVIRRLNVEVTSASGDGLSLQQAATDWASEALTQALTELVEQLPPKLDLALDVVELELEAVAGSEWQRTLAERVRHLLRDQLAQAVTEQAAERERERAAALPPSPRSTGGAVLAFFLRHGRLPWYGDGEGLQAELSQLLRGGAPDLTELSALQAGLAGSRDAALRLVRLLPEPVLWAWLSHRGGVSAGWWSRAAADLRRMEAQLRGSLAGAALARAPGRRLPDALFVQLLIAGERLDGSPRGGAGAAQRAAAAPTWLHHAVYRWLRDAQHSDADLQNGLPTASPEALRSFETPEFASALAHSTEGNALAPEGQTPVPSENLSNLPVQPAQAFDVSGDLEEEARREGAFIEHAGLILLSPYLSTYLQRLGLVEEGHLRDPCAALSALHYIASGTFAVPLEHELVLAKLLCGVPPEEPPSSLLPPTQRACEEGDDLLRSVIAHWTTLRNSSLSGLREGFLQRPGKLSLDARDRWCVQVEQRPHDMLLSTLPWGFQMTRLPWMERWLVAEWLG